MLAVRWYRESVYRLESGRRRKVLETRTMRWDEEIVDLEETHPHVSLGFAPPELEGEMTREGHHGRLLRRDPTP